MKTIGKWLLYAVAAVGLFMLGAFLSVRLDLDPSSSDAAPSLSTDASTEVPTERASGPPPGYEPPAPQDTPCLQPQFVSRCIGRSTARTGLMSLAGLQEAHMRANGTYTADVSRIGFRPEGTMELEVRADSAGWSAQYRHRATGVGCAIWVGETEPFPAPEGGVPESAGAVGCDDPLVSGG